MIGILLSMTRKLVKPKTSRKLKLVVQRKKKSSFVITDPLGEGGLSLSSEPEFKYVESGVEDEIENFGKTVGGRPRNISEMLRVIEIRLAAGRNKFYLQFIFNPWAYHSKPPIVEITSVNCQDMDADFFSIQQIDADEGRFRIYRFTTTMIGPLKIGRKIKTLRNFGPLLSMY